MKGISIKFYSVVLIALLVVIIQFKVSAEEGWKRQISLGYNQSNGNTDKSELNLSGEMYCSKRPKYSSTPE